MLRAFLSLKEKFVSGILDEKKFIRRKWMITCRGSSRHDALIFCPLSHVELNKGTPTERSYVKTLHAVCHTVFLIELVQASGPRKCHRLFQCLLFYIKLARLYSTCVEHHNVCACTISNSSVGRAIDC